MDIVMESSIIKKSKNMKRVSFSPDTKQESDTKEHVVLFHKCILNFFSNPRMTSFDILLLLRTKKYSDLVLINYFLRESTIIKNKLEELKRFEDIYKGVEEYFIKNRNTYRVEEDPVWDNPHYKIATKKRLQKGVAVVRKGSRIYTEKLVTVHLPYLEKYINLLLETRAIIKHKHKLNETKTV